MKGRSLTLICCGAKKSAVPVVAIDLYKSPSYGCARRWAESIAPRYDIAIMSAKHGIIPALKVTEPYEQRMLEDDGFRMELAARIAKQLDELEVIEVRGLLFGPYHDVLEAAIGLTGRSIVRRLVVGGIFSHLWYSKDRRGIVPAIGVERINRKPVANRGTEVATEF